MINKLKVQLEGTNTFNLSHDTKLSFKMGRLIPIANIQALPGDIFNIDTEHLLRFAPLIAPIMHQVDIHVDWFFTPYRILWDGWAPFIDGRQDLEIPYVEVNEIAAGSVGNYLGLPATRIGPNATAGTAINILDLAAYARVYQDWYRGTLDDDSIDGPEVNIYEQKLLSGENALPWKLLLELADGFYTGWNHDYFTTAMNEAQLGDEIEIPVFNSRYVDTEPNGETNIYTDTGAANTGNFNLEADGDHIQSPAGFKKQLDTHARIDTETGILGTVRELRVAKALQRWLEIASAAGKRHVDNLYARWGITPQDARLQRTELIGRSKSQMSITEVLSTAETENANIGEMAGKGISYDRSSRHTYRVPEYGVVQGFITVRPKTAYFQGIPKDFKRFERFDYADPTFAHIGNQPILDREIYAFEKGDSEEIFGYTERYAEYKTRTDRVAGDFVDDYSHWTFARRFGEQPVLNNDFLNCIPPLDPFAVIETTQDNILAHVYNDIKVTRRLPVHGTPTL